jgi:hypothetical protein
MPTLYSTIARRRTTPIGFESQQEAIRYNTMTSYWVGSILYYARAVDMTVLMALSSIAVEQTTATEKTMKRCHQLLDYLATNFEAKV